MLSLACRLQMSVWRASEESVASGHLQISQEVKWYWYHCCFQLLQHIEFLHMLSRFDDVLLDARLESACLFRQMVLDCNMIDLMLCKGESREEALHRVHRELVVLFGGFLQSLKNKNWDAEWWFQYFNLRRYQSYCADSLQEVIDVQRALHAEIPDTLDEGQEQRVTFSKLFARIYFFSGAPAASRCQSCKSRTLRQGCRDCRDLGEEADQLTQILADPLRRLEQLKQASEELRI